MCGLDIKQVVESYEITIEVNLYAALWVTYLTYYTYSTDKRLLAAVTVLSKAIHKFYFYREI